MHAVEHDRLHTPITQVIAQTNDAHRLANQPLPQPRRAGHQLVHGLGDVLTLDILAGDLAPLIGLGHGHQHALDDGALEAIRRGTTFGKFHGRTHRTAGFVPHDHQ